MHSVLQIYNLENAVFATCLPYEHLVFRNQFKDTYNYICIKKCVLKPGQLVNCL